MEGVKGKVCVTGGTGFVASWLIMRLLQHGYSVNTTIRSDPDHKKDVSYLTNLPGASKRLQIFNADLDRPESFSAPIEGCMGVFHTAHPIDLEGKEDEDAIIKRSISGTIGILQASVDAKTVKKVVYTSSAATVMLFIGDQSLFEYPSNTSFVHVDDVASAHIFLLECPIAKGRNICSAVDKVTLELPNFLSERYPEYEIPSEGLMKQVKDSKYYSCSSEKLLKIGFKYKYGIEETYDEAIQCCKKKGLL